MPRVEHRSPARPSTRPTLTRTHGSCSSVKLMKDGKKGLAERILRQALERAEAAPTARASRCSSRPCATRRPIIEVKPRRVGGATYQVPVEIRADRRISLAMRWLVQSARTRRGKS